VGELEVGRTQGLSLPDVNRLPWVSVQRSKSEPALPLVTDLGPGETQVLMLALESRDAVVVLEDSNSQYGPITGENGLISTHPGPF
jgi:hypothetical protein